MDVNYWKRCNPQGLDRIQSVVEDGANGCAHGQELQEGGFLRSNAMVGGENSSQERRADRGAACWEDNDSVPDDSRAFGQRRFAAANPLHLDGSPHVKAQWL